VPPHKLTWIAFAETKAGIVFSDGLGFLAATAMAVTISNQTVGITAIAFGCGW
jgi:hypothetical protein